MLRSNPPQQSIKIRPNTSWSCHHGIARWKEACPCSPTGDWKANLRSAMDELGAMLDGLYVKELTSCLDDPWQLVYQFIHVLHGKTSVKGLVEAVCGMRPDEETTTRVDYLLRAHQQTAHVHLMGWFFEVFDRIEPRNSHVTPMPCGDQIALAST